MTNLSDIELREVVEGDISYLQRIYAYHVEKGSASFEEIPPDLDEMFRRWQAIKKHGLPYILAERKNHILGFAYAGPYRPRSAYRYTVEDSIYIDPASIRQGIGRRLLIELIARSTALGKRQMLAIIGDSANLASIKLHADLGFSSIGMFHSIGFKFGRWVDSVLMQKSLGDGHHTRPE